MSVDPSPRSTDPEVVIERVLGPDCGRDLGAEVVCALERAGWRLVTASAASGDPVARETTPPTVASEQDVRTP